MGACGCKNRNTKTASEKMIDAPLLSDTKNNQNKSGQTFKLRSDAQPYVPAVPAAPASDGGEDDEVRESWELFLEQKKKDLVAHQRGQLRRQRDGNYTSEYRNLLVRPVAPWSRSGQNRNERSRSPDRRWGNKNQDFDVRGAWRAAGQKRAPSPPPGLGPIVVAKKRKPTALKKAILAQRDDSTRNELWSKFETHMQKFNTAKVNDAATVAAEVKALDVKPVGKDDSLATVARVPFGLSDRCYLSDAEDSSKAHRHREDGHALIREYVNMELTPELEDAVTETLFMLRRLRMTEIGMGQKPKRYAVGFREVQRLIGQKAVNCLIVAPDVERTSGALEDKIAGLVKACEDQGVPVVFALSRRQLGAAIQKNVTVSVLAIQEVRGAVTEFTRMLDEATKSRAMVSPDIQ